MISEERECQLRCLPFPWYGVIISHDLSKQAFSGSQLIICRDAPISNFGLYSSPERRLVFDLNDFDEAAPGLWECDLKRLITSIILCGEELGLRDDQIIEIATKVAMCYRVGLRKVFKKSEGITSSVYRKSIKKSLKYDDIDDIFFENHEILDSKFHL